MSNQDLLIDTMKATHKNVEELAAVVEKAMSKLGQTEIADQCSSVRANLERTESMYGTLKAANTGDATELLGDVKKYAADVIAADGEKLQASLTQKAQQMESEAKERIKNLEARLISDFAAGGGGTDEPGTPRRTGGDGQILRKVTLRMNDFETQVSNQLQMMTLDMEKKLAFLGSQRPAAGGQSEEAASVSARDIEAVKYDIGELKDIVSGTKSDTAHVKRIVLACERDMEDFTAAMDAVNVDLDEMRARVDSTHSIITSRQRVEATVTAEISTMRLDMGDMQEALKAHDAWMEDVSQSLQEAHERSHQLSEDISELRDQTQAKLDAKADITQWNDMNDDLDASIKSVREMASSLHMEVDSRRRKVDEMIAQIRIDAKSLDDKVDTNKATLLTRMEEAGDAVAQRFDVAEGRLSDHDSKLTAHSETHADIYAKQAEYQSSTEEHFGKVNSSIRQQDQDLRKEMTDGLDSVNQHHANTTKDTSKKISALDLRISGLQGASGEARRDLNKLRDEVNNLTVKSAAHDVDIGKNGDDVRKLERQRAEDVQRHRQDMDATYEELDQKVSEKSFHNLEDNTTKLTRGIVKLCQVVGVFPGARMNDGTEEELDVDVELLNWEDCAQNLTARVEKVWRQQSSQKFRSILDLVSKKADHSVLRLLQISQQHIESQLDRVRHERELWKEVVDKRAQQPLQLALTLKDPHTGQPIAGPTAATFPGGPTFPAPQNFTPRPQPPQQDHLMMQSASIGPATTVASSVAVPAQPLNKRIEKKPNNNAPPQR